MQFQANPESIPFFLAAAISVALSRFALQRRARPVALAFALMMAGEAAWSFFEALELVVVDIETKRLCFALRATGTVTMILSLLATVLLYTGRDQWAQPRRFTLICAPAILLLVLAWTNPWHHLYWTRLWKRLDQRPLDRDAGLRTALQGSFYLLRHPRGNFYLSAGQRRLPLGRRLSRPGRVHALRNRLALDYQYHRHVTGFRIHYVDSAAMSFVITGLAFVPGLFRYRLLDLTPVAWAVVVDGSRTRSSRSIRPAGLSS